MTMFVLALIKNDSAEDINVTTLLSSVNDPQKLEGIFNNNNFKKAAKLWLPFMNERGFLNAIESE